MTTKKDNIGFLCNSTSLGGLELNILKRAIWLKQRGWNVFFFLIEGSPLEKKATPTNLILIRMKSQRRYFDIKQIRKLIKEIKGKNISLLYIRDNRDINLTVFSKLLSGNRFKIIYHQGMQIGISKRDLYHTFVYSFIDAWLSPLPWLAEQVKKMTRLNPEKIHLVALGLELEKFTGTTITKEKARKIKKLPDEAFLIGIIGRIDRGKGQDVLIRAMNILVKEHNDIHLVIVGETTRNEGEDYLHHLQELIKQYKLHDHIIFHDFTDTPEIYYRAFDICAVASLKETFGTVTIEAMASGCPVIGTNSGGTPEILAHGTLGLLFEPGNHHEFAGKVLELYQKPSVAEKISTEAARNALDSYSHHSECDKLERIIHLLLYPQDPILYESNPPSIDQK